jgi:hypothetical protein
MHTGVFCARIFGCLELYSPRGFGSSSSQSSDRRIAHALCSWECDPWLLGRCSIAEGVICPLGRDIIMAQLVVSAIQRLACRHDARCR